MVMSSSEPVLIPETVLILKDRLKHGQNVAKILESQVDTAQQNILLLQGQVRLANETICNLKKHFQETENILTKLFEPEPPQPPPHHHRNTYESEAKDLTAKITHTPKPAELTTAAAVAAATTSPVLHDSGTESNKSFDDNNNCNKSPYAQQLRQVLDVLQDEEPRKSANSHRHSSDSQHKDCSDCPQKCNCGNASCNGEHYNKRDDYCKSKHKVNGHSNSHEVSPKPFSRSDAPPPPPPPHTVHTPYPNHCSGPCCSTSDAPSYKVVEKATTPVHYISVQSPSHVGEKHGERHAGHCGEKCQCHAFVNYVPYGYHLVESAPGIPESIQPISPSQRRKRSYVPVLGAGEEPPHLKYTKVKRIDGSKLSAQKMLQDFTKRRFLSYNPRYDLDLLIVPPPIPAFDLLKDGKSHRKLEKANSEGFPPEPPHHHSATNGSDRSVSEGVNGIDITDRHLINSYDMNNIDQNNSGSDNGADVLNSSNIANDNVFSDDNNNSSNTPNNNTDAINNNNSSNNNNTSNVNNNNGNNNTSNGNNTNNFVHPLFKSPCSNVKLMPVIKEENVDGRKKLENHISNIRAECDDRRDCNYSIGMKQERTMSPITVGSNRT